MSELGPIADRLEEIGHPGPAAAVRTLEFLLGEKDRTDFAQAIAPAVTRLAEDGNPEMAMAVQHAYHELARRRGEESGPPRFAGHSDMARQFPEVRDAISAWIDDPAPKLTGISVGLFHADDYHDPAVLLRMERRHAGTIWRGSHLVQEGYLLRSRLPVGRIVFDYLEAMHRQAIEAIRHPEEAPR